MSKITIYNRIKQIYPEFANENLEILMRFVLEDLQHSYFPSIQFDDLEKDNDFLTICIFGICAEYCLTIANFEDALTWHNKQVNLIKAKVQKDKEMEERKNEISRQI